MGKRVGHNFRILVTLPLSAIVGKLDTYYYHMYAENKEKDFVIKGL